MTGGVIAGFLTGLLTGAGIGGGTLLMVWLTNFGGMALRQAQAVNLLYFLLTAPPALLGHRKNGLVERDLARKAAAAGVLAAAVTAFLTAGLEVALLKKAFGLFTCAVGLRELFCRKAE